MFWPADSIDEFLMALIPKPYLYIYRGGLSPTPFLLTLGSHLLCDIVSNSFLRSREMISMAVPFQPFTELFNKVPAGLLGSASSVKIQPVSFIKCDISTAFTPPIQFLMSVWFPLHTVCLWWLPYIVKSTFSGYSVTWILAMDRSYLPYWLRPVYFLTFSVFLSFPLTSHLEFCLGMMWSPH